MNRPVNPSAVPPSPFYSHGIEVQGAQRTLYVSGQVGVGPDGAARSGIADQTRQAVANLNAVLAEAGMSASDIVKLTIYLTDPSNVGPFSQAAAGALGSPPPATTLLIVKGLGGPELLVEMEAIAAR